MFALKSTHIFISNHKRKQLDISKLLISSCYCTYKGTEFLANHNETALVEMDLKVVIEPTKVLNF